MIFIILNQSINEIQQAYLKLKYLKADFIQTIKTKEGNSISYEGYLEYKSPNELTFYIKEPIEQSIKLKDSLFITIMGNDTDIRIMPKNSMFNPYYFLTEGFKLYKTEIKNYSDKIEILLNSDKNFYSNVKFILNKKDYNLLSVQAIDIYGVEYELKLKNIIKH